MMVRRALTIAACLCVGVLAASTASAQRSVIRGLVLDPQGEPVTGASVVAESPMSNRVVESETNDSGQFAFIGLQNGRWLFTVRKLGYRDAQAFAPVRRAGSSGRITLRMEIDPLNPPPPSSGQLAGLRGGEIQASVDAAHDLFDRGDFDGAISAYEALLAEIPTLTSLNLQIGHAYREKQDYTKAEEAYRRVPTESLAFSEAELAMQELTAIVGRTR